MHSLKVGIIGSGFAAKFHFEALKRVYGVRPEISGAYSPTTKNLKDFCAERNIKDYSSVESLIDEADVLHLCTPPSTHEELCVQILEKDKYAIVEKPLTGYFGDGEPDFCGDTFSREKGLQQTLESLRRILEAEATSKGRILYAENWIYAPAIQKEKDVIEKTNAQILWIQAQQSHSGSHSSAYGKWKLSGGGSLMGKGCHPLAAAIYLKYVEGRKRNGQPIRPRSVSCRVQAITRLHNYHNNNYLRDSYTDVEDYANVHIVFEDGTVADITASELSHGGVKNFLEVHAHNHRSICNLTPNNAMQTYNPEEKNFDGIYVVEKTGTKQGWSNISPDEAWFNGYQHEMEAFYNDIVFGRIPESNSMLAVDVISTIYVAYLSAERKGVEIPVTLI